MASTKDVDQYCDICHAPMQQVKFAVVGHLKSGARKRMFECTLCDYRKMVFANGFVQNIIEQMNAEKDSKKVSEPVKY